MGGGTSEPERAPIHSSLTDPRYGGLIYLSAPTATAYQQIITEQRGLPKLLQLANRRRSLTHPHLLTVRNHFFKPQTAASSFACGLQPKCELYLEYHYLTRTLEEVIESYSAREEAIPQKEVVRIFNAVVRVLEFLARNSSCHGDVKPGNILFDHLNTPKLIDSYFIHGGKTAYELVLQNPSSMSLLAPEQLQHIKHRRFEDLSTIHMSEVFSLGLTMLEAMTFEAAMECYNLDKLQIKEGWVDRKAKELEGSTYSPALCALVLACLRGEPAERPTFRQFLQGLDGC